MKHVIYFTKKRVPIEDYEAETRYYKKWIQEHHYDKQERFRASFFFQITQYQNSAKVWMGYIQDLEKQIKELTGKSNVRRTIVRRSGEPP